MTTTVFVPQKTARKPHAFAREIKDAIRQVRRDADGTYKGVATIQDTNTKVTIVFADEGFPDQPDINYHVHVTVRDAVGPPPTNSYIYSGCLRTTTHIELHVLTAPGAGNSVTFFWMLFRND